MQYVPQSCRKKETMFINYISTISINYTTGYRGSNDFIWHSKHGSNYMICRTKEAFDEILVYTNSINFKHKSIKINQEI
jgi:hypothetical protein